MADNRSYIIFVLVLAFLPVVFSDWLIDHLAPMGMFFVAFCDVLYQAVNIVQSLISKKRYNYQLILRIFLPISFGVVLAVTQNSEIDGINSEINKFVQALEQCANNDTCQQILAAAEKQNDLYRMHFSEGITTVDVLIRQEGDCYHVWGTPNFKRFSYRSICRKRIDGVTH